MAQGRFVDSIRGLANNRHLYRLRTRSAALVEADTFSPPSAPARPVPTLGPPAPQFATVIGGDRQIYLDWPPLLDRHVASYRLYRAETAAGLADLRHFGPDPDPRLLVELADPLVRCRDRQVLPPEGIDPAAVIAVHALVDFDPARPAHDQPRAFDYLAGRDASGALSLHRIADGLPLALVVATSPGEARAVTSAHQPPPFTDASCRPLRDYYYRLVAIDNDGVGSDPSATMAARAYDFAPARPVTWLSADFDPSGSQVLLRFAVDDSESRCIVQRRSARSSGWKAVGDWLHGPHEDAGPPRRWIFETIDADVSPGEAYQYQVRVVNGSGQANVEYNPVVVEE